MAPDLFNLYFEAVMVDWRARCWGILGIEVLYKLDGQLMKNARTKGGQTLMVEDLAFADDSAGATVSFEKKCAATQLLVDVAAEWGLTVSITKTKVMPFGILGEGGRQSIPVQVAGGDIQHIESVSEFGYLGSVIQGDGNNDKDVELRIGKASRGVGVLRNSVFENGHLTIRTKMRVYESVVLSILLYGSELWILKKRDIRKLENFHNGCLRGVLGISRGQQWEQRLTTKELHREARVIDMETTIRKRRLQWLGC